MPFLFSRIWRISRLIIPVFMFIASAVWSNIVENGYDPEPTPEQIAELERRAEELRKNPQLGIPWEEVKAKIEAQLAARRKNPACTDKSKG